MQIETLKTVLAAGDRHLGDLCFWALESANIERSTLERLWSSAGLSVDLLPDPPSAEKAIKLAVREAQAGQKERLVRLAREDGVTVLFSTHILNDIERVCERVAVLHRGRLIASGDLGDLKRQHGVTHMDDLYLGLVKMQV